MLMKPNARVKIGVAVLPVGIAMLLLGSLPVDAQVWVPSSGQMSVDLTYQYTDIGDHLFSRPLAPELSGNGTDRQDRGQIVGHTGIVGMDLGVTDRLAASVSTAFMAARYDGDMPDGTIDDGSWNGGVQDFSLGLRYMAVRAPVVITPSIGVTLPTHSYETLGHSAIGHGLNELQVGLNLGWIGRTSLNGLYLQGSYTFAYVEKTDEGVRTNRSSVSLGTGYFLTENLVLWATGVHVLTHDGIDWVDAAEEGHADHLLAHDQLAKAKTTTAGGGLNYSIGPTSLGLGVLTTLSGENTHDATMFLFSVSRTFNVLR